MDIFPEMEEMDFWTLYMLSLLKYKGIKNVKKNQVFFDFLKITRESKCYSTWLLYCLRASLEKQIQASGTHALNHARACRLTVHCAAYRQLGVFVRSVEIFSTNWLHDTLYEIDNKSPDRTLCIERNVPFSILYLRARAWAWASGYQTVANCDKKSLAHLGPILLFLLFGDVRLSIRQYTV